MLEDRTYSYQSNTNPKPAPTDIVKPARRFAGQGIVRRKGTHGAHCLVSVHRHKKKCRLLDTHKLAADGKERDVNQCWLKEEPCFRMPLTVSQLSNDPELVSHLWISANATLDMQRRETWLHGAC